MSFADFGLSAPLLEALESQGFENPTPIQAQAIPAVLQGKDVLGIAPTGSGKTASYVLPLLKAVATRPKAQNRHVTALILVPTRELAMQVQAVLGGFAEALSDRVKTLAVFGGVSINPQMMKLQGVHVLVATPGRLLELVEKKSVHLTDTQMLVLDEADKMLNLGFKAEVDQVLSLLPKRRQNLLFSATLSEEVRHMHQGLLQDPVVINVAPKEESVEQIEQRAYHVLADKKGPLLRHLLKTEAWEQVLIFTSSIYQADHVADKLRSHGFDARATHSKRSHSSRTHALKDFKAKHFPILVATDLISRGIDIEFLPCVINYELPRSPKDFIHRMGRTGRAEARGEAVSFITPDDLHHFKVIQKKMKRWVKLTYSEDMDF